MRLVCLSDTHGLHRRIAEVPEGDVLIHAGDCLGQGKLANVEDLNDWLGTLPHRYKLVIAGNHDRAFQDTPDAARACLTNAVYLEDNGVEIEGIRFWGSPWTPTFQDWHFMLDRGQPLRERWQRIPEATDVLITHGPPRRIGDEIAVRGKCQNVGCLDLLERVGQLNLTAHVFGHIHEGYGVYDRDGLRFVNASICNARFQPVNPPIILDI
ncbi:metallophosphatase domain-containing protein [Marinobacter goseongensis]|uniref:metallophosphatase domain-containing protein n=1 Tax=Marinobacter goseongensis TaxID=453838 RepID=UPI0020060882|nr:metallophosphatase domain-containing protein [Marinobacter goseongensis]MCK7553250.1 metallophosphatase domain-containing protein [Marinobacter goseongensis]